MSFCIHGLAVSYGIAIGRAHLVSQATLEVSHYLLPGKHVDAEVARFEEALHEVHLVDDRHGKHGKGPQTLRQAPSASRIQLRGYGDGA